MGLRAGTKEAGTQLGAETVPEGRLEPESGGQGRVSPGKGGEAPSPADLGESAGMDLRAKAKEAGTQTGPEQTPELSWDMPGRAGEGRERLERG